MDINMFQEENGIPNIVKQVVNYIFHNLHCIKCGQVSKVISDTQLEINFSTNITIDDNTTEQQSFIFDILPLPIKFTYEVGMQAVVWFFDYNEELFIKNKQNKNINYNSLKYQHSLSNGYVICPFSIVSNLFFDKEQTQLIDSQGASLTLSKKVELKNNDTDLKQVLLKVVDALNSVKDAINSLVVVSPAGNCTITPTAYQQQISQAISPLSNEIDKLLK